MYSSPEKSGLSLSDELLAPNVFLFTGCSAKETGDSHNVGYTAEAPGNDPCIGFLHLKARYFDYRGLHISFDFIPVSVRFPPSSDNVSWLTGRECITAWLDSWRASNLMWHGYTLSILYSSRMRLQLRYPVMPKSFYSLESIVLSPSLLLRAHRLYLQNLSFCSFSYSSTMYLIITKILSHCLLFLTFSLYSRRTRGSYRSRHYRTQ